MAQQVVKRQLMSDALRGVQWALVGLLHWHDKKDALRVRNGKDKKQYANPL
jgi:hypothetical protein